MLYIDGKKPMWVDIFFITLLFVNIFLLYLSPFISIKSFVFVVAFILYCFSFSFIMFCVLCVEACPYDALFMGSGFERGKYQRKDLLISVD